MDSVTASFTGKKSRALRSQDSQRAGRIESLVSFSHVLDDSAMRIPEAQRSGRG